MFMKCAFLQIINILFGLNFMEELHQARKIMKSFFKLLNIATQTDFYN